MHELQTIFPYDPSYRAADKFKTDSMHINFANKFSLLLGKYSCGNYRKSRKGVPVLLLQQFLNYFKSYVEQGHS